MRRDEMYFAAIGFLSGRIRFWIREFENNIDYRDLSSVQFGKRW
jgi:hypothetical protein